MNCPRCDAPMQQGTDGAKRVFACLPCGYVGSAEDAPPACDTEADLVLAIREALIADGYLVERVGQWRADRAGTDPGVADLLVSHRSWPPWLWAQFEVKLPGGALSTAQAQKVATGRMTVVRSVAEARQCVQSVRALVTIARKGQRR